MTVPDHRPGPSPARLALFDVDGTLMTSAGIAGRAIERALVEVAGQPVDRTGYSYAGRTDPQIVRDLLGRTDLNEAQIDAGIPAVLDAYLDRFRCDLEGATGPHLYPGILRLLERLEREPRVLLGLLTGNVERGADIKLGFFGIRRYFKLGAFGSDAADRNHLVPIAVRRAAAVNGVEYAPRQVVVIGDTPRDIECARENGARCVIVATGTYDLAELERHAPDRLFADFSDTEQVVAAILE